MDIAGQLRAAILGGKYPPGTLLPQTELAREFSVSRIPVRDALLSLAADRLVEVVPGKGARVIRLSAKELEEVFALRIMLECDLLRRAVPNAGDSEKAEAEYVLRRSSLEAGRPGWHVGDRDFHRTLYSAADRPRQMAIVDELRQICVIHASGYHALAAGTARWLDDHGAMTRAYADGRAEEAAALLAGHLEAARDSLLRLHSE
ncbi:GntR family transcriptional regulator [Novosphingobium beihaiensis]|uniref:GntR family transcriptional regulator n=1 Tax=Novosphingobium beihaiensis TaxID=2930389 RepID=A0ABT0BRW0_9SPHN|nr:GntR family transcriptional regulator [Novosphingobium beihaiensis]MCJ2187797.1 GntR family transcriptional regulator [Novosphingobium beihaiensis]